MEILTLPRCAYVYFIFTRGNFKWKAWRKHFLSNPCGYQIFKTNRSKFKPIHAYKGAWTKSFFGTDTTLVLVPHEYYAGRKYYLWESNFETTMYTCCDHVDHCQWSWPQWGGQGCHMTRVAIWQETPDGRLDSDPIEWWPRPIHNDQAHLEWSKHLSFQNLALRVLYVYTESCNNIQYWYTYYQHDQYEYLESWMSVFHTLITCTTVHILYTSFLN